MNDFLSFATTPPAKPASAPPATAGNAPPATDDSFSQVLADQRPPADGKSAKPAGEEPARGQAAGRGKPAKQAAADDAAPADAALALPETLLAQQTLEIAIQVAAQWPGQRAAADGGRSSAEAGRARGETLADTRVDGRALGLGREPDGIATTQARLQAGVEALAAGRTPAQPAALAADDASTALPAAAAVASAQQSTDPRTALRDAPLRVSAGTVAQPLANPRAESTDARWRLARQPELATPLQATPAGPVPTQELLAAAFVSADLARADARRADIRAESLEPAAPALPMGFAPATGQGASAPMVAHIAAPVGSAAWAPELGRQVMVMSQSADGARQTAELRLDPPDLGPLRITLSLQDGVAHAVFASAHSAVRTAVEAALPSLERALADAGISLGQADVNDQDRPDQEAGGFASGTGRNGAAGDGVLADAGEPAAANHRADPRALVDTFA